ncbi:MAG: phage tail tip lysozyme [Pusillimonas sp.]
MATFDVLAPQVISRLSKDLNLTPQQAAGIVGQLGYESEGLQAINERKPVVPGSRGGYGWSQWTGPRRRQFEDWAGQNSMDVATPEANYGFLVHELTNTPESRVLDQIRQAQDAQSAGRIFTDRFLRPGVPAYDKRASWTEQALNFILPAAQAGTVTGAMPWESDPVVGNQGSAPWDSDPVVQQQSVAPNGDSVTWNDAPMPLNQHNVHPHVAAEPSRKFDPAQMVNDSLRPFPNSPSPGQNTRSLGAGVAQGLTDTILGAGHWLGKGLDAIGADQSGQALVKNASDIRRGVGDWADQYKSESPYAGSIGRLGGNLASVYKAPLAIASGISRIAPLAKSAAPSVMRLAESVGSGGLRLGSSTGSRAGDVALRATGGSIAGGATAGLVNPNDVGTGAAIGAAGPLVLGVAGRVGQAIGGRRSAQATAQARNAPLMQTIKESTEAGYVIPPSSVNPSMRNTVLESISGKIATAQSASVRNQSVTDALARKALGLGDDAPLTADMLAQYRKAAYDAGYIPLRQIGPVQVDGLFTKSLDDIVKQYTGKGTIPAMARPEITDLADSYRLSGFDSSDAVDAIRALRETATEAFRKGDGALAKANRAIADSLEAQLERAAGSASPDLLNAFRQSRANIAKSHTIEKALRAGGGSVDAVKIARELQKGKPLSDELALIGKFANAFPKAAQPSAQVAGPGVSKLASAASTLLGGAGAVAAGPLGIGLGAIPFVVPPMVRSGLLSSAFQRGLSRPASVKPSQVGGLLGSQEIQQLLNRTAPLLGNQ